MNIGKKDIMWNLLATALKMASGVIILPVILKFLSTDEVGIWTIFLSFSSITLLFDFGFSATFSRSITYIFSGVSKLYKEGYEITEKGTEVNFILLKSTIKAMKWFYARISLVILIFLLAGGTFYIHYILKKSVREDNDLIYLSWIIYSFLISYQAYTLYFDSLLLGRGLVKRNKQIIVISQLFFILISLSLILFAKLGLLSLVIGQTVSVTINRALSYYSFYDEETKTKLKLITNADHKHVLQEISPNAVKIGITSFGSFLVNRSSVFVGSMFLPLASIASFGITKQVVDMIAVISTVLYSTYYPKMIQNRITDNTSQLKELYIKCIITYAAIFISTGILLILLGNYSLSLINTNTMFLGTSLLVLLLLTSFLENNHSIAGALLLTKNEVPFLKAAIFSGLLTLVLLIVFFKFTSLKLLGLILAPGIAQAVYQNWKWPLEVKKELNINRYDFFTAYRSLINTLFKQNK